MNIQATDFLDLSLKMYDLAKKRDNLQRYIDRNHTRNDSERNENNEEMVKITDEIEETQKKMDVIIGDFGKEDKMVSKIVSKFLTADYPDHPDETIIPGITEKDVFSYYEGVKGKMLSELKGREIFVGIVPKGYKVGQKPVYVRHPYDKKTDYIHINSIEDFDKYNGGRVLEIHVTMPATAPYYVVDFDAVEDWPTTKKITTEIADMLEKLPEVKNVEIRFSGKRGFHTLGWLKKPKPVAQAREDLKEHLRNTFGERKDLVIGESPKGKIGRAHV